MALKLLDDDEPAAFAILRESGASPFLLTCDHASNRIPRRLGSLGVGAQDLQRHVAWDIGAAGVTTWLAADLDAFAIFQNYSRLVIDCNRPLQADDLIATLSEHTEIPGNRSIDSAQRDMRVTEIFTPYHDRIALELNRRQTQVHPTVLVSIHSFTPVFKSVARPWHVGVLYNRDARLAVALMAVLKARGDLVVGDNEPYAVSDESDYTLPVHAERRGLAHVEIEIRQDLIAGPEEQRAWATLLSGALTEARLNILT